jgi:hypothetical protein
MPLVLDEVHVTFTEWKMKGVSNFLKYPAFVDGKFCSIMLLPNTLEKKFHVCLYGYFSFLTFKQDISCNDIFV